jgi:hypothetical protein
MDMLREWTQWDCQKLWSAGNVKEQTWKDGIQTAMSERSIRMGEWKNRRQWNMDSIKCGEFLDCEPVS